MPELSILENEDLAKHTSYRIGGPARHLVLPETREQLEEVFARIRQSKDPYFVLGNGSNVLAPTEGFPGWVIKTTNLYAKEISFIGHNTVIAGAGVLNARLIRACAERGLAGLEYLAGVPGTVGGAVFMNAGTSTGWIEKNIDEVEGFSLKQGARTHKKAELKFSYREQHFLAPDELVLRARFLLTPGEPASITQKVADSLKARKQAQPIEMPSCGSVFRNPPGANAWQLIDQAGLRGRQVGGARISPKHCNFIVNEGGATAADVLQLISLAKSTVREKFGVELVQEVIVMKPHYL